MTFYIDTSVIMYTAGADHTLRQPCERILDGVSSGAIDAVTSAEVVQEVLHRYLAINRPDMATRIARLTLDMFAPTLPVTHAIVRRLPDLAERYPELQARDLVHVATCIHEGITEIVSADRGFDRVAEVRRIDPLAFPA